MACVCPSTKPENMPTLTLKVRNKYVKYNFNLHQLEVVSRYGDPQLQVGVISSV